MDIATVVKFEKCDNEGDLKLLPCPFCNNEESVVYAQYKHTAGLRWAVLCMNCMAEIDPGWAQSKHAVRAIWNKRHKDTKTVE